MKKMSKLAIYAMMIAAPFMTSLDSYAGNKKGNKKLDKNYLPFAPGGPEPLHDSKNIFLKFGYSFNPINNSSGYKMGGYGKIKDKIYVGVSGEIYQDNNLPIISSSFQFDGTAKYMTKKGFYAELGLKVADIIHGKGESIFDEREYYDDNRKKSSNLNFGPTVGLGFNKDFFGFSLFGEGNFYWLPINSKLEKTKPVPRISVGVSF